MCPSNIHIISSGEAFAEANVATEEFDIESSSLEDVRLHSES